MKMTALILAVVLIFTLPAAAFAQSRALQIAPVLQFNGNTAICEVSVVGDNSTDTIKVRMYLMQGSICSVLWEETDTGSLYMLKQHTVNKGKTYKLMVEVTYNGVRQPTQYVTGTC